MRSYRRCLVLPNLEASMKQSIVQLQSDLFSSVPTPPALTTLQFLHDELAIAAMLNRLGHRTGKGHTWTETRVRSFRSDHGIAAFTVGEREARGEVTLEQAAKALGTSKMTVLRMIRAGTLS